MHKIIFRRDVGVMFLLLAILIGTACTGTGGQEPVVESPTRESEQTAVVPTSSPVKPEESISETPTEAVPEAVVEATLEPVEEPTDLPELTATDSPSEENIVLEDGTVIFTADDRSSRLMSLTASWNTNWNLHTIDYGDILSGGPPRDGIPAIDNPQFIPLSEAAAWLADNEPVVVVDLEGDARAYPLQILTWHEIANDTVGGIPVVVTFCPLCNSAIVFERVVEGEAVEFGVSGLLRNSDLIMYDRTNESLWQQFTGEGIVGDHAGKQLRFLPSSLVSFAEFKAAFPEGVVLSRETGFSRSYGENPYAGYDTIGSNPFLFTGELDDRLPAVARVVTVSLPDVDVAYPVETLAETGVIHDSQGGQDMVIFHSPGTASALGARVIAEAEDVGATGVFDPNLDGQNLTFRRDGNQFVDDQTGSRWNILGQAVSGELAGKTLSAVIHGDHFWFSWAAFRPETILYQP